jgi:hypothetical protein
MDAGDETEAGAGHAAGAASAPPSPERAQDRRERRGALSRRQSAASGSHEMTWAEMDRLMLDSIAKFPAAIEGAR